MTPNPSRLFLLAHQTQISGEVGGTHHIEPNDTPRAGETATTWFALVQAGGQPIPLEDCDCQLAVYDASKGTGDAEAIATPSLRAINVEGQTNVPAADITFPSVGAYDLVISGSAKENATFSPFELRFSITVAAGQKIETEAIAPPAPTPASSAPASSDTLLSRGLSPGPLPLGLGLVAIATLLFLATRLRP